MTLKKIIIDEFKAEMETTTRTFEAITNNIFDFSPHEKSKTVAELANHMLEIPSWVSAIVNNPELDWSQYTPPKSITNTEDLLNVYKENIATGIKALEEVSEEELQANWTMKKGDFTFFTVPKHIALKKLIISHTIHHRAQMGLNLRLNNLSVPASYVASADENLFA